MMKGRIRISIGLSVSILLILNILANPVVSLENNDSKKPSILSEDMEKMSSDVKNKITSLGISSSYFDEHFKISESAVTKGTSYEWKVALIEYSYSIDPYSTRFAVEFEKLDSNIKFEVPFTSLHEIKYVIPEKEKENLFKTNLGSKHSPIKITLSKEGNLTATAFDDMDNPKKRMSLDLESGVDIVQNITLKPDLSDGESKKNPFLDGTIMLILIIAILLIVVNKNIWRK